MEICQKQKIIRLSADLCLSIHGGYGGAMYHKGYYSYSRSDATSIIGNYKGNDLACDILCDPIS